MPLPDTNFWIIRAGRDGHVFHRFQNQGIAYLGWGEAGPIHPETGIADVRDLVEKSNTVVRRNKVGHITRMIWGFCCKVKVGDVLVTYDRQQRLYHVGLVQSDASCQPVIWADRKTGADFAVPGYGRKVDWSAAVSRDSLSPTARNHLGRPPTHFQLPAAVSAELRRLCA